MTEGMTGLTATVSGLIGTDDPPAVGIENPEGEARLLLICDHASNRVPAVLDRLGLADGVLAQHVAWDIGAADVARRIARRFDAPVVLSGYSRLVIDCNRDLADTTSIPAISDNIVIPGNEKLSKTEAVARADACFWPYHETIARLTAGMTARDGAPPAIVSIHSFTPVFGGFERPWHVGVLWNRDGRLAQPFIDALSANSDVHVGDNEPYSARENFGYSMAEHGEKAGIPHLLIEIRQDLIMDPGDAERWSGRVADALDAALSTLEM